MESLERFIHIKINSGIDYLQKLVKDRIIRVLQ